MACIWFSDELGGLGHIKMHVVTSDSPAYLVIGLGWLLLLLPAFVAIWYG
jgi:hypothetical protein